MSQDYIYNSGGSSGDSEGDLELNVTKDMRQEALLLKQRFSNDSYKEKADQHVMDLKIQKALSKLMMANAPGNREGGAAAGRKRGGTIKSDEDKFKIAALEFKALLNDMDEECMDFV